MPFQRDVLRKFTSALPAVGLSLSRVATVSRRPSIVIGSPTVKANETARSVDTKTGEPGRKEYSCGCRPSNSLGKSSAACSEPLYTTSIRSKRVVGMPETRSECRKTASVPPSGSTSPSISRRTVISPNCPAKPPAPIVKVSSYRAVADASAIPGDAARALKTAARSTPSEAKAAASPPDGPSLRAAAAEFGPLSFAENVKSGGTWETVTPTLASEEAPAAAGRDRESSTNVAQDSGWRGKWPPG